MHNKHLITDGACPLSPPSRSFPKKTFHLSFIGEVKWNPPDQEYFWLSAISLPFDAARDAEEALRLLSEQSFNTSLSTKETEFHAKDIFHAKKAFKGWSAEDRIKLFKDLIDVLACDKYIARIEIRLAPDKM